MSDQSWRDDALCAETDPNMFFPEQGEPALPAKRICQACDVQQQCLQYALDMEEQAGIWGGRTARELRRMRLRRDAA